MLAALLATLTWGPLPYQNPALAIERRIDDLLRRMTVEEKTCQLATLYGYRKVLQDPQPTPEWSKKLWKDGIANIDEHLNGFGVTTEWDAPASKHALALKVVQDWFRTNTRLGIPVDFSNEGIRGVVAAQATSFPNQMGLGASWDRDLVLRVGGITGAEAKAYGFTNVYSPILDTARDQRWGRYEECYSEDPFLVAEMGIQQARGLQNEGVVSTPKHFTVYGANKGAREDVSRTDPQIPPREAEELLVYPFRRVFQEAGSLGVMSSYNDYDGVPISGSPYWLTQRLRKDFGFRGYVVSDSDAVEYLASKHAVAKDYKEAVYQAVVAGLNVRTTFTPPEDYVNPLRELVKEGRIPIRVLDDRVRDVLRVKFWLGLFDPKERIAEDPDATVLSDAHRAVALEAARKSLVLVKNEGNVLPLVSRAGKIAVIGPNADSDSLTRKQYGPSKMPVTTVLAGLRQVFGADRILTAKGCDVVDAGFPMTEVLPQPMSDAERKLLDEAVAMARQADFVVAVLGDGTRTTGESKSRTSLELPGRQEALLEALSGTGKPVVLVLLNGRPMSINWAEKNVPAILIGWIPGMMTGQAIAEAIAGEINPSGKLPCTWIRTVGQIPYHFPTKPNAQYDVMKSYSAHVGGVLLPFGKGLSYTTFKYGNMKLSRDRVTLKAANAAMARIVALCGPDKPDLNRPWSGRKDVRVEDRTHGDALFSVSVDVTNTGGREGDEVVQIYLRDVVSSVTAYEKVLRGFARVNLKPGETKTITVPIRADDLALVDSKMKLFLEPGEFRVMVGASSEDIRAKASFWISD